MSCPQCQDKGYYKQDESSYFPCPCGAGKAPPSPAILPGRVYVILGEAGHVNGDCLGVISSPGLAETFLTHIADRDRHSPYDQYTAVVFQAWDTDRADGPAAWKRYERIPPFGWVAVSEKDWPI